MMFRLRSKCTYTAEIDFYSLGKEELLIEELMLMKNYWPSVSWEIGVNQFHISGNQQLLVEAAATQFLEAVKRHGWWRA